LKLREHSFTEKGSITSTEREVLIRAFFAIHMVRNQVRFGMGVLTFCKHDFIINL